MSSQYGLDRATSHVPSQHMGADTAGTLGWATPTPTSVSWNSGRAGIDVPQNLPQRWGCRQLYGEEGYEAGGTHSYLQSDSTFCFPQVINPDEVVIPDSATQKSLLAKLKSDKAWIEKITTHLILRDFTSFMEKTVRAVRYLKNTRSFSA